MTVHKEARTYTGSRLNLMHVLASEQESHRPLLTPEEALRLPPDAALVFVSGARPILGRKLHYFRDPTFAERARIAAPACSDRLPHTRGDWRENERLRATPPRANEQPHADDRDDAPITATVAEGAASPPLEVPPAVDGVAPFKALLKRSRPEPGTEDTEAKPSSRSLASSTGSARASAPRSTSASSARPPHAGSASALHPRRPAGALRDPR